MTDDDPSSLDTAVRERITELSVHIACGGIRGPIQQPSRAYPNLPIRWQSCRDEELPVKWEGADVSRMVDLCTICLRGNAGGPSRWAWTACTDCRAINDDIGKRWGFKPFELGRHSVMNGIGVRGGLGPEQRVAALEHLDEFRKGDSDIRAWRVREYRRLASRYDPLADIPLTTWQRDWPPGRQASRDAFDRLLGR
ncbi:hypothetical protein [Mycolicibacterium arenosum]|uniref:Uncharacterized protein n=1 Tax=Mycolicibacterium arenosum TaxID=2952157 RepID=A0ABT1M4F1_9MYCO|nr:hypothetical protein [Mycolicibacterium sp. CAU 1645]MCP9274043.1 hypothetical protein [Mycolicibacterium sp. CAU 1645]